MKYRIPDFSMEQLLRALYPQLRFHRTEGAIYTQCPVHRHVTPGLHGTFRVYPPGEGRPWGSYVCPCGAKGNPWRFLAEYHGLPPWESEDFDETVLFVCELLGIPAELRERARPDTRDAVREFYKALASKLTYVKFKQENEHYRRAEEGWLYRGQPPVAWLSYGCGMLSREALAELERQYGPEGFRLAGISRWRRGGFEWLTHGPLLLRKNAYGTVVGLAVRRYEELAGQAVTSMKYVKNTNNPLMGEGYVFGLREALSDKETPVVYVVEGEYDAAQLHMAGVRSVVTTGAGQPSALQLEQLRALGRPLYFICDNDENGAGVRHAEQIARRLPEACFVFLPSEDGAKVDPDTFVQRYGLEALLSTDAYTALQVEMWSEGVSDEGRWTRAPAALAERYMRRILKAPSAYDEQNVRFVALLSGLEESYLRSWLFYERNRAVVTPTEPLQIA